MKLRAIRMKEFRRFADPVAVENLSGGLDVLAAPNEDGKSTLFEAVRIVMEEKYNAGASSKKMKAIQPYVGGAPLIEIDFDLNGGAYRLRKQFVKRADALLSDRNTGKDIARKGDVEEWLSEHLMAKRPLGLFWVAQQASVTPALTIKSPDDQIASFRSVVEAEVGAIAGGQIRDLVHKSVSDDLDTLITSRGRKKNGAYDQAVTKRDTVAADLDAARQRRSEAEARLSRLETLRNERAALVEENENSEHRTRVREAEDAVKKAQQANTQLRSARQEEEAAKHQFSDMSSRLGAFDQRAKDQSELIAAQTRVAEQSQALQTELAESQKQWVALSEAKAKLDTKLEALRQSEKAMRIQEQRATLEDRASRLETALKEVVEIQERMDETSKFLAGEPVTAETVQTLQQIMNEVLILERHTEQTAPKVTVAYEKDARGRVHVGGEAVAEGVSHPVLERTEFTIDGIGILAVDPGESGQDEDTDDLGALRQQRDELMQTLGVSNLKQAQKRAADRSAKVGAQDLDRRRLADIAPDGIAQLDANLKAARTKLDALAQSEPGKEQRSRDSLEADIARMEAERTEQSQGLEAARQALHAVQLRETALNTETANLQKRINDLSQSLDRDSQGNDLGRDANRALLAEAANAAETRLNEAVRNVSAWAESYVNDDAMSALQDALNGARKEQEQSQTAIRKLDQERGEIEAVLRETAQDGIDETIGELEGELQRAERGVAWHEKRIAALKLLAQTLVDVAEETRESYTQPIVERLSPYLHTVFPEAKISFSEHFSADGLTRDGVVEDFSSVSLGTQEQIGVLTRLGFARLFADRGQPVPLILDDALVYSDDERIERMFDALRIAAEEHQVLVLTCRMRAFEGLGGNRVRIEPCTLA